MDSESLRLLREIHAMVSSLKTPEIFVALIALAGAIIAAWLAAKFQLKNTKMLIEAESKRIIDQANLDYSRHEAEITREKLRDLISDLVVETDPEITKPLNFRRAIQLIQQIQVRLNTSNPHHAAINDATSKIGFELRAGRIDNYTLCSLHGVLVENCRKL